MALRRNLSSHRPPLTRSGDPDTYHQDGGISSALSRRELISTGLVTLAGLIGAGGAGVYQTHQDIIERWPKRINSLAKEIEYLLDDRKNDWLIQRFNHFLTYVQSKAVTNEQRVELVQAINRIFGDKTVFIEDLMPAPPPGTMSSDVLPILYGEDWREKIQKRYPEAASQWDAFLGELGELVQDSTLIEDIARVVDVRINKTPKELTDRYPGVIKELKERGELPTDNQAMERLLPPLKRAVDEGWGDMVVAIARSYPKFITEPRIVLDNGNVKLNLKDYAAGNYKPKERESVSPDEMSDISLAVLQAKLYQAESRRAR